MFKFWKWHQISSELKSWCGLYSCFLFLGFNSDCGWPALSHLGWILVNLVAPRWRFTHRTAPWEIWTQWRQPVVGMYCNTYVPSALEGRVCILRTYMSSWTRVLSYYASLHREIHVCLTVLRPVSSQSWLPYPMHPTPPVRCGESQFCPLSALEAKTCSRNSQVM
jgi:hypothetical protein